MTQVVTALYDSYDSAVAAVNALEDAGFPHSEISIVSNNDDDRYPRDDRTKTAEDAGKGAGIGAAIGGVGGLLTGLGLMAIPGVGPVVAAGWLAATAAGAATGAVVGGAAGERRRLRPVRLGPRLSATGAGRRQPPQRRPAAHQRSHRARRAARAVRRPGRVGQRRAAGTRWAAGSARGVACDAGLVSWGFPDR